MVFFEKTNQPVKTSLIALTAFIVFTSLTVGLIMGVTSCGGSKTSQSNQENYSPEKVDGNSEDKASLVFLGDSLTEGYRVGIDENYPTLVEKKLAEQGYSLKVVNGGLSGDTSSGGVERLDWFLKLQPDYLFLALGSNDGLRGLKLEETYNNLSTIIERSQEQGIQVFLAGLKLPPNYGADYTEKFENIFVRLSEVYSLPLYPFLLEGVAGETEFNLEDGIHPNEQGYEIISDGVAAFIAENLP